MRPRQDRASAGGRTHRAAPPRHQTCPGCPPAPRRAATSVARGSAASEVRRRRSRRVHAGGADPRRGTRRRRSSRRGARSARLAAPSHIPAGTARPT